MSELCPVAASVYAMNLEDQPETMGGSLLSLLSSKKFCNVIFTFANRPERIEAHKFCLKARSSVFEQIFRMRKSGNVQGSEIEISESTPEIFQQFLEFIYADKLKVNIAEALELMQLSQKYKVHPLTKKCKELLETEIPIVDSVKVFQTARHYGRRELMDRAGQIMVKSFSELVRTGGLAHAEEETLLYVLEYDDLAVKEVEFFEIILSWGRNQVGNSVDEELLRNKLKNLISKIRYTNMAPDEFTKVVVPTGLLSLEETVSVYSYLCGDEITRKDSKIKFNTTRRKLITRVTMARPVSFYSHQTAHARNYPAFSKHWISFNTSRTQADGKLWPNYLLKKTAITKITYFWPSIKVDYRENHILNFDVTIGEYSGPLTEGSFTTRFHEKLFSRQPHVWDSVSIEPPVELISGRTYFVIFEDHSTVDSMDSFRNDPSAYLGLLFSNTSQQENVNLEDVCVTLKEICRKTVHYAQRFSDFSKLAVIRGIEIGLI